jgi:ribosomal protein L6P/L9E
VTVTGPKGTLSYSLLDGVMMKLEDNIITFSITGDDKKNLRGLSRVLVDNMIV